MHYTTRVRESFARGMKAKATNEKMKAMQSHLANMDGLAAEAHAFLLPEDGELIENITMRHFSHDLFRLPYPVVTLEFTSELARKVMVKNGGTGRMVLLIADTSKEKLSYGQFMTCLLFELAGSAWGTVMDAVFYDFVTDGEEFKFLAKTIPNPILGQVAPDLEKWVINYTLRVMTQFMMAVNCANVTRELKEAPPALNKKREKKGKLPLNDYWVLDIVKEHFAANAHQGGTHESPRLHFRRGHIRRRFGKSFWIRPHMVGRPELGEITKDYKITHGRKYDQHA